MSKMSLILLLPQLLMVLWIMPGSSYGYIGCAAVSAAGETTVICVFEKDISQKGFSVHRYHTPGSREEMVLECNRQVSGELICDKGGDTKFDENQTFTNQLILTRPTSKNTQGVIVQYLCEVVPSEKDRVERCNVIFKGVPAAPSATTTTANTLSQPMDDSDPLDVAVLVFIIVFIIAMMIICATCYIMRKRCLYNRIRKRWFSTINESWPGAIGDPEEPPSNNASPVEQSSPAAASSRDIPKGLADFFYKLGWKDAMKEEDSKRAIQQQEHREQEQQNQDKAQSEAGPKQDAQKKQRNKKGKGDQGKEANQMESALAGDPMLHPPPSSLIEGRQSWVPSGAVAQGQVEEQFFECNEGEPSRNEEPPEKRPEGKRKRSIGQRVTQLLTKKKGGEDQQQKVPKAEPQQGIKEATKNENKEVTKQTTVV